MSSTYQKGNILQLSEQADTNTAVDFLKKLDPQGYHNLVAIDPDGVERVKGRTFGPDEFDNMHLWIEAHQGKRNLYFSVNEPEPDAPDKKLQKGNIANIRAVYIDVDPHGDDFDGERERIAALSNSLSHDLVCPPSAVIDSGGGYQFFWFLDTKLPSKDAGEWAEAQSNALGLKYGGDATFDVNRIMRLPGTVNLPDKRKRAKGRKRAPTGIVMLNEEKHSRTILENWCAPVIPHRREQLEGSPIDPSVLSLASFDEIEPIDAKLKDFLDNETPPGDDLSGSAYLFHLAQYMRKSNYPISRFAQVAWLWDKTNLSAKPDPMRQMQRAWERCGSVSAAEEFNAIAPEDVPTPKPKRLYALSFKDAADRALSITANPLIKGVLDRGAMSVLYGESNVGKSFVMLDMAFAIAAGHDWNGKQTHKGLVVYVAAEGGGSFLKRVAAIRKAKDVDGEPPLAIVPCPVDLFNPTGDLKELTTLIKECEAQYGEQAELIVIDTLARAIAGGDENSSSDMGTLVRNLDKIRATTKAHVAVVHHSGKDKAKGARGHSSLRAATDTEIEIADKQIAFTKQRDLEMLSPIPFLLKVIDVGQDPQGEKVTSCVVLYGEDFKDDAADFASIPLTNLEKQFMERVEEYCENKAYSTLGDTTGERAGEIVLTIRELSEFAPEDMKKGDRKKLQRFVKTLIDKRALLKGSYNEYRIAAYKGTPEVSAGVPEEAKAGSTSDFDILT